MTRLLAWLLPLLLAACASAPPPPDWKLNAQGALEAHHGHYLDGHTRLADLSYAKARAEVARTGRPDLAARVALARCGVRAAALVFDDCPDYRAVAEAAAATERHYAGFLSGDWTGVEAAALPEAYRPLLARPEVATLAEVRDPVSRLIGAGVLFRQGRLPPEGLTLAIDTASEQGWRRPLLAWLGVALARAREAGDSPAVARLTARIALVESAQLR
ncbi:MAG: hypothetical protein ACOZB0_09340 [Pseudomonadota bacterium]